MYTDYKALSGTWVSWEGLRNCLFTYLSPQSQHLTATFFDQDFFHSSRRAFDAPASRGFSFQGSEVLVCWMGFLSSVCLIFEVLWTET